MKLIYEGGYEGTDLEEYLNATLNGEHTHRRKNLIRQLKARGGQEQLIMLLTGPAGCGKSTSLELAQQYFHNFYAAVSVDFDNTTFYFTSTTGSSAAMFGGNTIHSAAHLNKKRITDKLRRDWEHIKLLVIDEVSFFKVSEVKKLDKQLKKLTERRDLPFGGVSIVFSGDFHQLLPICKIEDILYSSSPGAMFWENSINCVIFLENSHRFKDDPEYGEILGRMRMGKDTKEDREKINSRVLGTNGVQLPNESDVCYACPTNKERNGIKAGVFKKLIDATHPSVDSDELPPIHTLTIEASLRRKKKNVSRAIHDVVLTKLGDDSVKSTEFTTQGAKLEPLLRVYPGAPFMCNTNDDLDKGRGNGTTCRCLGVTLKPGANITWKNWDGKKVNTVSVNDVQWLHLEHWPKQPRNASRFFKIKPRNFSSKMEFPISQFDDDLRLTIGNVSFTQFPINSNIATTGHKLQGMSKDALIVNSWNYSFANWIYVVLSRVRTLSGLYLCSPLDMNKPRDRTNLLKCQKN